MKKLQITILDDADIEEVIANIRSSLEYDNIEAEIEEVE